MANTGSSIPGRGPFDLKGLLGPGRLAADPTVWSLVAANLATIAFAFLERWDVRTVLWIYWWQSVVIGFFNVLKILMLRDFTTENFKLGDQPAQPTAGTRVFTALFFAFHYGFFHLVYAIFLACNIFDRIAPRAVAAPAVRTAAVFDLNLALFLAHGLYAFLSRRDWAVPRQNIGTVMFAPYYRIVPMHLTIIFGGFLCGFFGTGAVLYLFLLLKTASDVVSHLVSRAFTGQQNTSI